jgi:hypothetical protein
LDRRIEKMSIFWLGYDFLSYNYPIVYEGGILILEFIDIEYDTWNMDSMILEKPLKSTTIAKP